MSALGLPFIPLSTPDSKGTIDPQQHIADWQQLNQQVASLLQMQRCQARNVGAQAINNTTNTPLTFDTNVYDNASIHSTAVNPTRFVARSDGFYLAIGQVSLPSALGTIAAIWVEVNGLNPTPFPTFQTTPNGVGVLQVVAPMQLKYLDYVEFFCFQDSGIVVNTLPARTFGSLTLLSRL